MVVLRNGLSTILLLVGLSSCWTPIFNEAAALSAVTASKLRLEASFSDTLYQYAANSTWIAYPSRDLPPTNVMIVNVSNTEFSYTAYARNGSGYGYITSGQNDSNYKYALGDPEEVVVYAGSTVNAFAIFSPAIGFGTTYYYTGLNLPLNGSHSTTPQSLVGITQSTLALSNNFSGLYLERDASLLYLRNDAGAGFFSAPGAPTQFSNFGLSGNGWLAFDSTNTYTYTDSKKSNGLYKTMQFTNVLTKSWERSDRVVTYLNGSNELLTRDGNFYNVCSLDGSIKYTFPAGRLRFTYEFWDSVFSSYRCFFTEVIAESSGGSNNFTARIYSIATNDLVKLK